MTTRSWLVTAALAIIVLATLGSMLYTVSETEQVVITQFGEPIGAPITQAGLHVKLPFAQDVNVFDKRWLEWTGSPNQVPTRDKKYIWVDTTARWQINDLRKFAETVQSEQDQKLNASSSLCLKESEMQVLQEALKSVDGSFQRLFEDFHGLALIVIGDHHFGLERLDRVGGFGGCHGVGQVHGNEGDVDVLQRAHFRHAFGVARDRKSTRLNSSH